MLKLSNLGAIILPASPGFYHQPQTIDDLVDFVVARILNLLEIPRTCCRAGASITCRAAMTERRILSLGVVALLLALQGCAAVRTLDAAKPGAPIIYSGTRLDWYSLNGGCCPMDRFGAEAPGWAAFDLPFSALLETLLLPFAVAAELGVGLGVTGGN